MKINWTMPASRTVLFDEQLASYRRALAAGERTAAWRHLELAHIVGQPYPVPHTYTHLLMTAFAARELNVREVLGQIPRIVVGFWKSLFDHVPIGNTGGANVPPLRRMPIPSELVGRL
jgi:hypothetical protein